MRGLKYKLSIVLIITFFVSANGKTYLQLGARPQGMGGAFVALANNADAVYWNPSGLSLIGRCHANFMHWNFIDISQVMVDYLSIVYPLKLGAVGFSWARQAAELEEGPLITKSTMSENSFLFSYGFPVTSRMSFGLSVNRSVINSKIGNGGGTGFEFGWLCRLLEYSKWTIGITVKNVAANLKNESLKPSYLFGTAYQYSSNNDVNHLSLAFDLSTIEDVDNKEGVTLNYAGGIEYILKFNDYAFALRCGFGRKNYAFGCGLSLNFLSIDYAYVQMRDKTIGDSHKFGFSFRFGGSTKEKIVGSGNKNVIYPVKYLDILQLSGKLDRDKIRLRWIPVPKSDGYQIFGRISGGEWKLLNKNLVRTTAVAFSYSQQDKKIQFLVRAVGGGKIISESNVFSIDLSP